MPRALFEQLQAGITFAIGIITLGGLLLGMRMLLIPKIVLINRLRMFERRAITAESALESVSMALDALRGEVTALRADVAHVRMTLGESTIYVASVIRYFRGRGTVAGMPEPPASIREAVLAEVYGRDVVGPQSVASVVDVAASVLDH